MAYKQTYNQKNGAAEGLEKKLKYWKDNEFNIVLGQAFNLANERVALDDDGHFEKVVKMYFDEIVKMRQDEDIRAAWEKYKNAEARKIEQYQRSLDETESDINADNLENL